MLVKFFAYYRDLCGCQRRELPAPANVGQLLQQLGADYGPEVAHKLLSPDATTLGPDTIVLVNGRNIAHTGGYNTPLKDSDNVSIFPLVGGG
jgi:molybdopterin synthase sulfur carrier subunit